MAPVGPGRPGGASAVGGGGPGLEKSPKIVTVQTTLLHGGYHLGTHPPPWARAGGRPQRSREPRGTSPSGRTAAAPAPGHGPPPSVGGIRGEGRRGGVWTPPVDVGGLRDPPLSSLLITPPPNHPPSPDTLVLRARPSSRGGERCARTSRKKYALKYAD